MGQLEMHRDPGSTRAATWRHLSNKVLADQHRLVYAARQRQALNEQHFGFSALLTVTEQIHGPA